jgi:hypothetical protein
MFNLKTQFENSKITRRLLDIVDNDTVDPDFYHVVSTVTLMVDQGPGDTHISDGDIGMSVTCDGIDIVDINDEDTKSLLQLKLFKPGSLAKIKKYLRAYLVTNRDFLHEEQVEELEELLEEVQ